MKSRRRRGTGIILALLAISLAGPAVFILSEVSHSMFHYANSDYAEADAINLAASATDWARLNRQQSGPTTLDVGQLGIPEGSARVEISTDGSGEAVAVISTQCRRGRMFIRRTVTQSLAAVE